jgi:tetratricopeptide (TPR) repeat protein
MNRRSVWRMVILLVVALSPLPAALAADGPATPAPPLAEVLVYPTREDGSIMHWLAVSPLAYNVAFIGDSMSYDVFKRDGTTELAIRPRAGDRSQGQTWRKMHYGGTVEGPTMCALFDVAGYGFEYAITPSFVYIYSPQDRPKAVFSGSADDALKVVLNGKKIWTNQIQRSPTYDSDQCPAPLKKGWNALLCVVDQVWGGHLLCARFLDDGKALTDLEISLDPPADDAVRHPAEAYNKQAAELIRAADALKGEGKLDEAVTAYAQVTSKFPLADCAPRAAHARAACLFSPVGDKSLDKPREAAEALEALLARYGQDLLAEYALLDLGRIQAAALKDPAKAEATFRSFEQRYPQSTLAAKSLIEVARLLGGQGKSDDAVLVYRKAIGKYPKSDEVMTATVGIADAWRLAGQADKAAKQYQAARAMAQDWHDNKYGVDVGKQAWLQGILEELRKRLPQ